MKIEMEFSLEDIILNLFLSCQVSSHEKSTDLLVVIIDNKTNIKKLKAELRYFQTKRKTKNIIILKKEELSDFVIKNLNTNIFPIFLYKKIKIDNKQNIIELEKFVKNSLF